MAYKFIFSKNERSGFSDVNCHWWRGNEIGEHFHLDYYEVIIATEGEHYQILDGKSIRMERGKCLILSPLTSHRIDKSNARHYNLAVKSALFEKLCANKPQIRSELSLLGYAEITPSETAFAFISECIGQIDNNNIGSYSYTLIETVLSVLLLSFMKENDTPKSDSAAYYCLDAINKIESGAFIDKSAKEIYDTYPISHTAFIAEFKSLTGTTPSRYLATRRLTYAKMLLLTTDMPLLEVANEVGYDSVSHFIKVFKSHYGKTPRAIRAEDADSDTVYYRNG